MDVIHGIIQCQNILDSQWTHRRHVQTACRLVGAKERMEALLKAAMMDAREDLAFMSSTDDSDCEDMKVPRRVVAIEIRQGTSPISRKNNFSIRDQICPTNGHYWLLPSH